MKEVKTHYLLAALLLVLAAVLFFPVGSDGSGVFYVSISFLLIAVMLSSLGSTPKQGIAYLRIIPKKGEIAPLLAWSVAALLACCLVTGAVSAVLYFLGWLDTAPVGEKILSLPLPALLAAFTLAPLGEETLFRGYLFRKISECLRERMTKQKQRAKLKEDSSYSGLFPAAIAALISSLLFSALHFSYGSFAELAVAFSIGIVLCAFTQKSKSLLPAILAHASFNLLSILFTVLL